MFWRVFVYGKVHFGYGKVGFVYGKLHLCTENKNKTFYDCFDKNIKILSKYIIYLFIS